MFVFKYRYLYPFPYQEKDRLALGSVCAPLALSVIVIVWVGVRRCICLSGKCSIPLKTESCCYFALCPLILYKSASHFSCPCVSLDCCISQLFFRSSLIQYPTFKKTKPQMCVGDTVYVHVSY